MTGELSERELAEDYTNRGAKPIEDNLFGEPFAPIPDIPRKIKVWSGGSFVRREGQERNYQSDVSRL